MKKITILLLAFMAFFQLECQVWTIEPQFKLAKALPVDTVVPASVIDYGDGITPMGSRKNREAFLKHIRDSIDAIPFDTTRDDDYWRRAIVNGEWSFFTDPTVKKPFPINLASKAYNFYTKAFNNYDTTYVVGIDEDWKFMLINDDWLDSYGGMIGSKDLRVFMHSIITPSVGIHMSYMGIGYTYMFDLSHLIGGDRLRHNKWEMSFSTSRFSLEFYRSNNSESVKIGRFGNYNDGKSIKIKFDGLKRVSSGFDMYYFFNHRKYSQNAAYNYSKIQRRSAGTFIAGLLISTQKVDIDFSTLSPELTKFIPGDGISLNYKYHYRTYSFLLGYAYNWVFYRNWLLNITLMPAIGWNHTFGDSVEGEGNLFSSHFRGRLGLVRNFKHFFFGLQFHIDAHLFHSKTEDFINTINNLNAVIGLRF